MRIHLIRHGKTIANEQRLYCGATDLPLSTKGVAELMHLRSLGIYPKADDDSVYFTSGLQRTEQTLDLLYGDINRKILPQLAEYNFGDFEMQSYNTLKDCDDYKAWISDDSGIVPCPNGESKGVFTQRVMEGFYSQIADKDIFMICHGGVIACIMENLCPNTQNFYEWQPETGRGYTLIYISGMYNHYKII